MQYTSSQHLHRHHHHHHHHYPTDSMQTRRQKHNPGSLWTGNPGMSNTVFCMHVSRCRCEWQVVSSEMSHARFETTKTPMMANGSYLLPGLLLVFLKQFWNVCNYIFYSIIPITLPIVTMVVHAPQCAKAILKTRTQIWDAFFSGTIVQYW